MKRIFCKKEKETIKILEKELQRLKEENKKLKKEIKKQKILLSSKDELISAISHEFKNPISIINGYIQTILESNLDEETTKKFLQKIEKNSLRLSNLIDRLYIFIKLENEKITLKKENFDIFKTAKTIIDSLNSDRIILKGKSKIVFADKNLIEIVLYNLISNALKYSSKDVIVQIGNKIEIIDFGKGIDKDKINLIKEKFYRISKNDWDNSLGLGLFIVDRILKLHSSELKIESSPKGSKFYFEL